MAIAAGSQSGFYAFAGVERYDKVPFPMFQNEADARDAGKISDVRMELVNNLRRAIALDNYRVSSAELARKLMKSMGDSSTVRFRRNAGDAGPASLRNSLPTHGFAHATFRTSQASESAEEVNHERVGKVERDRWT
jgi:hypothetical protein